MTRASPAVRQARKVMSPPSDVSEYVGRCASVSKRPARRTGPSPFHTTRRWLRVRLAVRLRIFAGVGEPERPEALLQPRIQPLFAAAVQQFLEHQVDERLK